MMKRFSKHILIPSKADMEDYLVRCLAIVIVGGFVLALIGSSAYYSLGTVAEAQIVVEKAFTLKNSKDMPDQMVVRSSSGDLYKVDDSLFHWKFRSSDIWSAMKPGDTWKIYYFGYRIGVLSLYPTIYEAELVSEKPGGQK